MLTVYRSSLCLVLLICLPTLSCSAAKDLGKTLGELAIVRAELTKKFGEQDVSLHVNTSQNRGSPLQNRRANGGRPGQSEKNV
jgi:hypothetical protein